MRNHCCSIYKFLLVSESSFVYLPEQLGLELTSTKGIQRMPRKSARKVVAKKTVKASSAPTKGSTAAQLSGLIDRLRIEHQDHLDAIAEIDQTFKDFGITFGGAAAKGGRGRKAAAAVKAAPAKPAKKGRKAKSATKKTAAKASSGRNKFPITGAQLVLDFVKETGGATTEEIRTKWESAGRGGKADNHLTELVKSGQLKRVKVEGKQGSRYELA